MRNIDQYAYISGLKDQSFQWRIRWGGTALLACICSRSLISFAMIFVIMSSITIFKAGIYRADYIRLMIIPLCFLFLSVIGIIVNIDRLPSPPDCVFLWEIGNYCLFISENGLSLACRLICKSLSAASCFYFIILTTPFREMLCFLHGLRCPPILITLAMLIYQFIFLLMEMAVVKMKSQLCRGGYRNIKGFARSFAMLWGSVFIQSYLKSEWVYKSMQTRGYDGQIPLTSENICPDKKEIVQLLLFFLLMVIPNWF
ncbi:MAG: cobalt ECF transporter T component CbiQ [Planctomycetaceae bacterium]|jgi:cobalt/nickel transport system permease protein|nr:cobalt ECF transporter T component CbiQ [Planctomycetaceae bacterium]